MTTFRALNLSQLGLNYCALLLDECLGDNHLCLSSCSVVLPPKSGRGEIDCAYVVLATRWWQQVPGQNEHSIIHAKLKRPSSFAPPSRGPIFCVPKSEQNSLRCRSSPGPVTWCLELRTKAMIPPLHRLAITTFANLLAIDGHGGCLLGRAHCRDTVRSCCGQCGWVVPSDASHR